MKNIIISVLCLILFSTQSLFAQSKVKEPKPFQPYLEVEASIAGKIGGSISPMKGFMENSGFGGTFTESGWFFISFYSTTTYPVLENKPSFCCTIRYQYNPTHGAALRYGIVEDYTLIGHTYGGTFSLHNKLTSASILYTLSTPNQRLKASAGPSYSWMESGSGDVISSIINTKPTVSSTVGLRMNLAFSFIQSRHFHIAYFIDANIAGSVRVGPYDTGSSMWDVPKLPVSTINHGLTLGIAF